MGKVRFATVRMAVSLGGVPKQMADAGSAARETAWRASRRAAPSAEALGRSRGGKRFRRIFEKNFAKRRPKAS